MNKRGRRKTRRKKPRKNTWWRRFRRKYARQITAICIILVFVLGIKFANKYLDPVPVPVERWTTETSTADYHGIDVSKHQGKINWDKVAEDHNIQFAYIKATEGESIQDSRYKENVRNARRVGIKVGSYHYFIGRKSAKEQFRNFQKLVSRKEQDLLPCVDVEEKGNSTIGRAELQANLKEFLELVKDEYGQYPVIYSQYSFYNDMLAPEFNDYFIFIARYSSQKPVLKGQGTYRMWQYSERGKVNGIKGHVDLDRFTNGTDLQDILY